MGGEAAAVAVVECDRDALAFVERGGDRVGEAPPSRIGSRQAVHDHEDLLRLSHPLLGGRGNVIRMGSGAACCAPTLTNSSTTSWTVSTFTTLPHFTHCWVPVRAHRSRRKS